MSEAERVDKERMIKYKMFAMAFSYPDNAFFSFFNGLTDEKVSLASEYDRLFRAGEIWRYGTEYLVKNEFQRQNQLSDIMGFYKAFGVEPDKDRPDSLSGELEFMHYLIFKRLKALSSKGVGVAHPVKASSKPNVAEDKASICLDAQKKFFAGHLYPAAKKIAEKIISITKNSFYIETAKELNDFMESEKKILGGAEV